MDFVLIEPNTDNVNRYYVLYDQEDHENPEQKWYVPLFEGMAWVDIRKYISAEEFRKWYNRDCEIYELVNAQRLEPLFQKINAYYSTRLNTKAIADELAEWNNLCSLTVDQFVEICYKCSKKRAYSFATKVFNFIDGKKYPILDSYVVTLLEYYLKQEKSAWNTYEKYLKAYNEFKFRNGLTELSYKKTDVFLWAYGKAVQKYWELNGVLSFESVPYKR